MRATGACSRAYIHAIGHVLERERLGRITSTLCPPANCLIGHLHHLSEKLEPFLALRPEEDRALHVLGGVRYRPRLVRRLMDRRAGEASRQHHSGFCFLGVFGGVNASESGRQAEQQRGDDARAAALNIILRA